MKAVAANFLGFLKESFQLTIPIYQRNYSWTERECRQLWDDILRVGENEEIPAHFTGSIVYIEKTLATVTQPTPLLVIDGQQRLTTVTLILEALARHVGKNEPVNGFSAEKLRTYYLLNHLEEGEHGFKLHLTQTDKASLRAIVQQKPEPIEPSLRIAENFAFFQKRLRALQRSELISFCHGLAKLTIVDISLDRDRDNPQLIFESMNSTGRALSQADLVRNFILMGLEPRDQTRLYEEHWRPMEMAFGQEAYDKSFTWFVRDYLTAKTGEIPIIGAVYEAFKYYSNKPKVAATGVDGLVADLHTYAGYYCAMALGKEPDKQLKAAFKDFRELGVDVAYPFLLELYDDYKKIRLSKSAFIQAVRLTEAYVFRRAVCGIPTNSLNKTFATFGRALKKDLYIESIQAHYLRLPTYRRFPSDEEFKRELCSRDLYHFRSRSYSLRRLENHNRKERVPVDEYTIEHIMPQNENLSEAWRNDLGPEWQQVQEQWLHTLGNLTLTGYNSEYGDRSFAEKREMTGGFGSSPLRLNKGLGRLLRWNEESIRKRGKQLAARAVKVWASPTLSTEQLATFLAPQLALPVYSLDDHPNLAPERPMRPVWDAFRKEVLALDPGVREVFTKLYVAFKAETNFVDVIPQKNRLLLSLNLRFHELRDPQSRARDVTDMGRWGNGNAEVGLSTIEELPYVMGLVRQALEKQLDSSGLENE